MCSRFDGTRENREDSSPADRRVSRQRLLLYLPGSLPRAICHSQIYLPSLASSEGSSDFPFYGVDSGIGCPRCTCACAYRAATAESGSPSTDPSYSCKYRAKIASMLAAARSQVKSSALLRVPRLALTQEKILIDTSYDKVRSSNQDWNIGHIYCPFLYARAHCVDIVVVWLCAANL
jgi:hypothetical protein